MACRPKALGPLAFRLTTTLMFVAAILLGGRPAVAQTSTPTVVGRMGVEMSERDVRRGIAFRPFVPPRHIVATALLPPFHGDDTRANRGIGIEYTDEADRRYALAEWPRNGGTIDRFEPLADGDGDCNGARTFARGAGPRGIVWSTPHGLIMTLVADGKNDARTLAVEWKKLVRRGSCR